MNLQGPIFIDLYDLFDAAREGHNTLMTDEGRNLSHTVMITPTTENTVNFELISKHADEKGKDLKTAELWD